MRRVDVQGHNNIVGNNNLILVTAGWLQDRERAKERAHFHRGRSNLLQLWALGVLAATVLLVTHVVPLAGVSMLICFGAGTFVTMAITARGQAHEREAQRLRTFYGLF